MMKLMLICISLHIILYNHIGDIDPIEGIIHAQSIANYISSTIPSSTKSTKIYSSPFLRCAHTASIIADKLQQKVYIEEGLYEWLIPSLLVEKDTNKRTYPNSTSELQSLSKLFESTIDTDYNSLNPYCIDDTNPNFAFPETNVEQILRRCNDTLQFILNHHPRHGYVNENKNSYDNEDDSNDEIENIIIVAHAPCVQALGFALEGVDNVKDYKFKQWPYGGITRFSRDVSYNSAADIGGDDGCVGNRKVNYEKWELDFYGKTEHMPGEYKNGLGLWSF